MAEGSGLSTIRYWKTGERPVNKRATAKIEPLVRAKHRERMRRKLSDYRELVAAVSETRTNERLQMINELGFEGQLREAGSAGRHQFLMAGLSSLG